MHHPRRGVAALATIGTLALLVSGATSQRTNWPVYAAVLLLGGATVAWLDARHRWSTATVWGLVTFGLGHLAGGMIGVGDGVLYDVWLLDGVLRYDNLQHAVGFGVVGRATWETLRGRLRPAPADAAAVAWIVVVLGAAAFGAVNEVVEYVMTLVLAETNVGGYDNTARDLIANLVGGVAVGAWTAAQARADAAEHPTTSTTREVAR